MASGRLEFEPPAEPPPFLKSEEVQHLASQGWLSVRTTRVVDSAVHSLFQHADHYFDQDQEDKQRQYPACRGTECGYYHVPDEKEFLTLRQSVHHDSELEERGREVWRHAGALLHRILCDLCRAGGYDLHAWDHLLQGSLALPGESCDLDNVTTLMRLFRYYPRNGTAAEHADIGLLTLCMGDGKGLQVLDCSSRPPHWLDLHGPVVLVGRVARRLLSDRVRAGVHRVVGNPSGRSSMVFALRPCLTNPTDLSAFGAHGVVSTRDLYLGIKGGRYNVNAKKEIRVQQQKAREASRKRLPEFSE